MYFRGNKFDNDNNIYLDIPQRTASSIQVVACWLLGAKLPAQPVLVFEIDTRSTCDQMW